MNKILLSLAVLAGIHLCDSPRALAQNTTVPLTVRATTSTDDLVEQHMALVRQRIESTRKQLIAANVTLTDTEATKFWPLYEQYSAELKKLMDTKTALIKEYGDDYGSLTDEQADSLVRRWLDADIAALELHRKYLPIFRKALGAKVTATFFQVDHRVNMMIDLQLASQLPLVQSQDSSTNPFTPEAEVQ